MNPNNREFELREVATNELQTVEGGWSLGAINIMHLLADWGASTEQQETWVASLPPSRRP